MQHQGLQVDPKKLPGFGGRHPKIYQKSEVKMWEITLTLHIFMTHVT